MTSGQFNAELFALANGANFAADATYKTFGTEHPAYNGTAHNLTLERTPVEGSVSIAGLDPSATDAAGTARTPDFSVTGKVISIAQGVYGDSAWKVADGDPVEVSYEYVETTANVIEIDNKTSAIGEAVFKWPVYQAGGDCTESSIKGYVVMHLYRCRVTQMPKQNWAA